MSRRLLDPMPGHVTTPQRRASDPRSSAWVRANAGSGKTHVLTQRVMRLLLSGVRPEEILCLTYTKAAAAEMRRRVGAQLAEWALLPEAELVARLAAIEEAPPSQATVARARTLFAHALEAPGGLKINTIHAFCEAVLHRFPLEAGVPFDFEVIEEAEAEALIRRSREAVIAEGLRGEAEISGAVETLFGLLSDHAMTLAIDAALAEGRKLRHVLADRDAAKSRLRGMVFMPQGETREAVLRDVLDGYGLSREDHAAVLTISPPKTGSDDFEDRLDRLRLVFEPQAIFETFLTKDMKVPKRFPRKAITLADPDLSARLVAEAERLEILAARLRRATLIERSEALLDLLGAIVARYEQHKRARSRLDFDDLIRGLGDLFANGAHADWVRYKLDAGITHILVDESQDTNPEQWRVVEELQREFFAGDGAVERTRTIFAVGDEKQSIFSFQGAEPALFGELGRRFEVAATAAGLAFAHVPLHTSFRTLPGILSAVDRVFAGARLSAAVLATGEGVDHQTARFDPGGVVTLWPPIREIGEDSDPENWPLEPKARLQSAPRRLAERIAGEIRGWLDDRRPLGPRGRAVRAEDILILVQTRSALFTELIRALGMRGIPTPGADRLPVTDHIAVLDLLALGDVLANPADSLQLAALLRSPLFDVSEDDLYGIAAGRPKGQTLWAALEASPLPSARDAFERLRRWRGRLDFGRPFEFYAEVLYREEGLKRFHARLGGEIDDVMVEFLELALAHEQAASPSLQGFLAEMRAQDISIKRDLAEPGSGVRVMTVHGAKGLEAPIVILADAASKPAPSLLPPVFVVKEAPGPLLVHASKRDTHTPQTLAFRDAAEAAGEAEYWRKLYVGMTRAEDELYVTGYLTRKAKPDGSWYEAVEGALGPHAERIEAEDGGLAALVFPERIPAGAAPAGEARPNGRLLPLTLPPLPPPAAVQTIRPSTAAAADNFERVFETAVEALVTADEARRSGIALHALLQHLGRVPHAAWEKVVEKAVPQLLPEASAESRGALGRKAVSILSRPEYAELFGPLSRAEVPFLIDAVRDGKPVRLAGRIDRLVVANGRVLVVDYKSDAVPARTVPEVPASYVMQVGLYAYVASQLFPGLTVEAGILWTALESLMILPAAALRDAVSAFTMR
jgi:ATP-dependent helicase/nuclease subunit A